MAEFFQIVRDGLTAETSGKPAGDHVSADLLAAFQEGRLTASERGMVMEHLASCTSCREALVLATPALETPAVQVVRKAWLRSPTLRWGAAAAAFATLLIAVGVHQYRPALEVRSVAVSRAEPSPQTRQALPAAPEPPSSAPAQAAAEAPSMGAKLGTAAPRPKAKQEVRAKLPGKAAPVAEIATIQGSITVTEYQELRARGPDIGAGTIGRLAAESAPEAPPPQAPPAQPFWPSVMQLTPVLTTRSAGMGAAVMQAAPAPTEEANAPSQSPVLGGMAPRSSSETIYLRKALDLAKRRIIGVPTIRPGTSGALAETGAASMPVSAPWGSMVVWRGTVTLTGTAWNITQLGRLQRSLDGGRTWQVILPDATSKFRVMCTAGDNVWVGSQDGVLFRSSDNGEHWVRIGSPWDRGSASATILNIDFSDALHGLLLASNGDTWETFDGGNSWTRR